MNQNNFLKKSVEEICKCLQRKQVKLQDIVMHVKVQLSNKTYSEDLLNGKEDHILPILDIISESYEIKNHQMCCKAIDLIDKLFLYQSIKPVNVTYKGTECQLIIIITELLTSLFKYQITPMNLYIAKCLTTIIDKHSQTLSSQHVLLIFNTMYDMYVITPENDLNNGAYQMCIGRMIDIITSLMSKKTELNGEFSKGNIQQGMTLFQSFIVINVIAFTFMG